ncbi:MAG: gliding motility-associated ABC transporter substrate-binding protein GldG [Flavobacteriales bacterium]|nr:gliding motility-associated ABC transporter substrate-binding protein GldG [Flavobacteriales bacterium]
MVMRQKRIHFIQLLCLILFLLLINIISEQFYIRIDLTKEKRYSLAEETKNILNQLDDYVYIEVYLEGDFPSGIERLSLETKRILTEFKSYNALFQFSFINPTESPDRKTQNEIINQLYKKGLTPTTLQVKNGDNYSEKIIVPGAIVKYGGKEKPIQLLKSQISRNPEQNIQNSIRELEYEFTNAILNLQTTVKPSIGFLRGHGELVDLEIGDLTKSLSEKYTIDNVNLREFELDSLGEPDLMKKLNQIKLKKLIVIAKPKFTFLDLDKYLIDQYIMNGGKVLWLIDGTMADMDSLSNKSSFLAYPFRELNLSDQLFKYGIRVNSNIIEDISSSKIPIPVSFTNKNPQWELMPWRYFPVSIPTSDHPITSNLNAVKFDFVGSIDTVTTNPEIKKIILLETSPYTKLSNTPFEISLQSALNPPDQEKFNNGPQALAVLVEGNFQSIFKNRLSPLNKKIEFVSNSRDTKMIVISDGDIAKNKISRGQPLPLGFDNYEKRQYGNKDFLLNCIDFLLEDDALIQIRTREMKMRLLDIQKINKERLFWQVTNLISPLLVIVLIGLTTNIIRRKYAN